jgi:hypothetical protein
MMTRSLLVLSICGLALSSAIAGFNIREGVERQPSVKKQDRVLEDPEPAKKAQPQPQSREAMEKHKIFLNRLLTELQRSPRSFIYLRSIGFTQSDHEFEKLIAENDAIFQRTRIVRRDEKGERQTPGWPGISLLEEFRTAGR